MRRMLLASVAIATLGVSAQRAVAADVPAPVYKAAPPVAAFSWTGCYFGGHVGGGWARKEWVDTLSGTFDGRQEPSGWLGGVQAGCNYQTGAFVFGIQGDYAWSDISARAVADPNGTFDPDEQLRSRISSISSVTGRVGYAFDRFLGYVKGGGAWVRDHYQEFDVTGTLLSDARETRGGWTVGIGGEYAFAPNWSAFVEYNHYDFGTRTVAFYDTAGAFSFNEDIRQRVDVVKGGINFRFGPFGR